MTAPTPPARPTPGSLAGLVGLGVLIALWSLFLWAELVSARAGAVPFCPLGEAAECTALWDGGFARAIHSWTGLPVAAWGVAWGLAAAALPLLALQRLAEGRSAAALVSGTRVVAAGGVAAVIVFGGVAAAAGSFCAGCFATYVVVAGYAGIALFGWQHLGLPQPSQGFANAAGATAAAFLLLLVPGLKTPKSAADVGRAALERGAGKGNPALEEFLGTLAPGLKQTLSDSLFIHKNGIALPPGPARALLGSPNAKLRLTEFTDVLCDHCAQLHETLQQLRQMAPPDSFSIEPRQFPLDAECNAAVQRREGPLRCLAAKAQICVEGHEKAFEYSGALFAKQKTLTTGDVYALAAPYMKRPELEACIQSPETNAKLQADIELAMRYELDGTPLVLLNGRKAVAFPPFLYAMALTQGQIDHPAFASLPPANPSAHIH